LEQAADFEVRGLALLRELKATTAATLFGFGDQAGKSAIADHIPLGDVVTTFQYGLSIRGEQQGRTPILRMNCQEDGRVVFREMQYVNVDDSRLAAFEVQSGDLLFNRTNSYELVGRTAIFEEGPRCVFASYLIRLTVDRDRILPGFLNQYLNSTEAQRGLKQLATRGVSQSNISASKLRDFRVPVPSLAKQHETTDMLNVIDDLIAARKKSAMTATELYDGTLKRLVCGNARLQMRQHD
jgi:type I restriction enzyme S subunit